MRPLTDVCPKPLLKAGGKALIEFHIEALAKAGFTELVINHAYRGKQIEEYLGDGSRYGVHIDYSPEPEALETGGGIFNALHLLNHSPFLIVNGDIWTDYDFSHLPKYIDGFAHLVMINNPTHNPEGDFFFHENRLLPAGARKFTYSGIAIYHPEIFSQCKPGKFPLAPLLRNAIAQNRVSAELYQGRWMDIGTPQRLAALDDLLKAQFSD